MRRVGVLMWLVACGGGVSSAEQVSPDASAVDAGADVLGIDVAMPDAGADVVADASSDASPDAKKCESPMVTDPCDCRAGKISCADTDECAPLASCSAPFRYDPGGCFKDFRLSGTDDCAASDGGAALCCASFF